MLTGAQGISASCLWLFIRDINSGLLTKFLTIIVIMKLMLNYTNYVSS